MKLSWAIFKIEIRKILAYRLSFWINFFGTTIGQLAISYFLWLAIFEQSKKTLIGGMNFNMMILYSFLAPMTLKVALGLQLLSINEDIYDGGLNKYIIYPLSYFQFKWIQQITHSLSYLAQLFVGLFFYFLCFEFPPEAIPQLPNVLLFAINLFISSTLFFVMETIIEMTAFWADNIWSLSVLLRFIISFLSGAWLPLSLYPKWSQEIFTYLPFKGMVYSPVSILIGQMTYYEWAQSQLVVIIWIGLFLLLIKKIWRRGNVHYTGIGI